METSSNLGIDMALKPTIMVPLMHEIGGLRVCIGEAVVNDNTITWRFRGTEGEKILDMVRDDLTKAARSGGFEIFDLMTPVRSRTDPS
jgi:hypothetical protein